MRSQAMTADQVAEYLQVSRRTVYRLIERRELAASRRGRCFVIAPEAIDAFLLEHGKDRKYRAAQFRRVFEIGQRNPDLDGDQLLEWLEAQDELRKSQSA